MFALKTQLTIQNYILRNRVRTTMVRQKNVKCKKQFRHVVGTRRRNDPVDGDTGRELFRVVCTEVVWGERVLCVNIDKRDIGLFTSGDS